jgi:hypothetical protein
MINKKLKKTREIKSYLIIIKNQSRSSKVMNERKNEKEREIFFK